MMENPRSERENLLWVWLALFAVLGFFATGRWAFPLAAWLAAVFGIRFYRNYPRAGRGYLLLAAAAFASGVPAWWGATFAEGNPAGEVIFGAVGAAFAPVAFLADRWVVRRVRGAGTAPFWTSLAFPLFATAGALIFVGKSPLGTFGADAYSQYGWEPMMQLAAVTGLWGFTFLMAWFATVVNYAWEAGFAWRKCASGVVAYGTVLAVVVAFGFGRLWLSPDADIEVRVVGVTSGVDLAELIENRAEPGFDAEVAALHDEYLSRTAAAASRGAEIVVWPEVAGLGYGDQVAALIDAGGELAAEHGIYLVMPTLVIPEEGEAASNNEVRIFTPAGDIGLTHVKYGGNTAKIYGERGAQELRTLETPYGTLSALLCWDADYADVVTQAGRMGVDLLFVSARDWSEIKDIHAQMAVFRAVENGVPLVRQTSNGVSLVADAYGRVLSYTDTFRGVFEQDVRVPLNGTATLYSDLRDAFGWAAVLGFLLIVIITLLRGRPKLIPPEPVSPPPVDERVMAKTGA